MIFQEEGTTIDISVIRKEGSLVERSVEYYIEPEVNSELEFYGANNVMRFAPGETVQNSTILARGDGIPEVGLITQSRNNAQFQSLSTVDFI